MGSPVALLALDDPTFSRLLADYLRKESFTLVLARNAGEALECCKKDAPDVVIASLLLPGMNGTGLTAEMKTIRPMPVVLISITTSGSFVNDLRRSSGADAILPRNFKPEFLLSTLRRLLSPPVTGTGKVLERIRTAPAASGPSLPVAPVSMEPALGGQASTSIDPAWILGRACVDRVSGALRFVREGVERILYLAEGAPVVATSNVPEERLGDILVTKELITASELTEALNFAAKKSLRLAEVLIGMGALTERERQEEVAAQYETRILAVFAWSEASVEFQPRPAPAEEILARLPPERLLMEGLRRHYPLARLQAALAPDRVLTPVSDLSERLAALGPDASESVTLARIDGVRPVADVCATSPDLSSALRIIYAALCLNLLL